MALAVEAGELLEHFQWMTEQQSMKLDKSTLYAVEQEIADVQIYLVRLADKIGIDVAKAVICHKAACMKASQPRPGSIPARSTAHRPETRRKPRAFRGTVAKEFPILLNQRQAVAGFNYRTASARSALSATVAFLTARRLHSSNT
jgi:hypothetical protein